MSEIDEIKNNIVNIKGRRKKILWLVQNLHNKRIFVGCFWLEVNCKTVCYVKKKICLLCKQNGCYDSWTRIKIINHNYLTYFSCDNCFICKTCLRESSRCSLIHTRKLLCYKMLLSHKFPKDLIKLITKKVK